MFSVLLVAFFLLLNNPCLAIRPQTFHSLDHNHTTHKNQKNFSSSSLLETMAGNAPNTALFIKTVHDLCSSASHPTTAWEYFTCLQTNVKNKALPKVLTDYQTKLLHEVGDNSKPRTVVVEGLGPIGGFLALAARLNDDEVIVIEKHEIFKENQAFTLYPASLETLIGLGFDYSEYGFPKSSLQYIYLFLLGLFPDKIQYYPYEVVGWNEETNEVVTLHWNSASTRENQRKKLEESGWYHKDYTAWKTIITNPFWHDGSPVVEIAQVYPLKADLIIAAGGPNSAFHYLIPGVQTAFNAGGDPTNKIITTAAIIAKIPLLDDGTPMAAKAFDDLDAKIFKTTTIAKRSDNHQAKFVPRKAYDGTVANELWIERLFTLTELTSLWKTKGVPELFTGKKTTLADFTGRVVHSNLHREINFAIATAETALLGEILVSVEELTAFQQEKPKTPLVLTGVEVAGFLVSNRILPIENLVNELPSKEDTPKVKVIFLGDSFHESLFLKGNGVMIHMMEVIGEPKQIPALPTMNKIFDDEDTDLVTWVKGAYAFGLKYVTGMNAILK